MSVRKRRKLMEAATTVAGGRVQDYPGRWLAALVMIGAATMDLIDLTIVNVALPTIRADLGASGTELEWVISAYMLAFRGDPDRRRELRRPAGPQAALLRRNRNLRPGESGRRPGAGTRGVDRGSGRAGCRGSGDDPAAARDLPGDLRR